MFTRQMKGKRKRMKRIISNLEEGMEREADEERGKWLKRDGRRER